MSEIASQFTGLPMADLIGGPLQAACEAQVSLANATADFIQRVGFSQDGKTARMVDFSFKRPGESATQSATSVSYRQEEVKMSVPFLTVVNTPALSIKKVSITFDMEVKSSTSSRESSDRSGKLDAEASLGFGCFKARVNISGSVSSHKENTRSTDTSAKYHVEVMAEDTGMPEGLHRLYDLLQSAIAPREIAYQEASASPVPAGAPAAKAA